MKQKRWFRVKPLKKRLLLDLLLKLIQDLILEFLKQINLILGQLSQAINLGLQLLLLEVCLAQQDQEVYLVLQELCLGQLIKDLDNLLAEDLDLESNQEDLEFNNLVLETKVFIYF
jgi:hypothetical protein